MVRSPVNLIKDYYFVQSRKDVENTLKILIDPKYNRSIDEQRILKSSIYLVTYNMIEGSLMDFLEKIYNAYNADQPHLSELSVKRQIFVCESENPPLENPSKSASDKKLNNKENFYQYMFSGQIPLHDHQAFLESYIEMKYERGKVKKSFDINGNVYETIYRDVNNKLNVGFDITIDNIKLKYINKYFPTEDILFKRSFVFKELQPLSKIKDIRNNLAHGEDFFSSSDSELLALSAEDTYQIITSARLYIEEFKDKVNEFILNKGRRST